jgi:hypothetical protein
MYKIAIEVAIVGALLAGDVANAAGTYVNSYEWRARPHP